MQTTLMLASVNVGCQANSGTGKIHQVILVLLEMLCQLKMLVLLEMLV